MPEGSSAHFRQDVFISCEDQIHKLGGLHNFACSLTGLVIMAHPVRSYLRARSVLPRAVVSRSDAVLYFAAQFLLFYQNLHQHATGYVNPDLEAAGALHSILLAQWLFNTAISRSSSSNDNDNGKNDQPPKREALSSQRRLALLAAAVVAWGAVLRLAVACWREPDEQTPLAAALGQPFALYVVGTMGYRSYRLLRRRRRRPFALWVLACGALAASRACVVIEQRYVCPARPSSGAAPDPRWLASRTFHPVIIHAVIVVLFYAVSECAIELVREAVAAPASGREKDD
jgi:hypothetical protein